MPILAILCDGTNFEFLVLDSVEQRAYSSGPIANEHSDKSKLLVSAKRSKYSMPSHPLVSVSIFKLTAAW